VRPLSMRERVANVCGARGCRRASLGRARFEHERVNPDRLKKLHRRGCGVIRSVAQPAGGDFFAWSLFEDGSNIKT